MAHPDHLSEVGPPAGAEGSGAIAGTASTPVGAVLSAVFHLVCIVFLVAFGTMQGEADTTVTVELVRLAPEPQPEPQPQPKPQEQPQAPKPQPAPVARKTPRPSSPPLTAPARTAPVPLMTTPASAPVGEAAPASQPGAQAVPPVQAREADITDYQSLIRARIMRFSPQRVPFAGTVKVAFALDGHGQLLSRQIALGSGSAWLDRAALDAVERAAPFPPPPAGSSAGQRTFVIPFHFR